MIGKVAIVGAGFSGSLLAINLMRHDGPRAVLIERAGTPGKGLAFGAAHPSHLLNVRAGNMSALPDDPDHFVRWLAARGVGDAAGTFVRRAAYGEYLAALLDEARQASGGRLEIVRGDAADLRATDGVEVDLTDGRVIDADAAVLAVGNLPPHDPAGIDPAVLTPDRYKGDPWAPGVAEGLSDHDTVLVVGSGLTMIDVALMLDAHGFRGRIAALSRRGLLPRRHAAAQGTERLRQRPATVASALVRTVRADGDAIGWRQAVDRLRPYTQAMWAQASEAQHSRFLRHLRPWWDVHRHRLAPAVADRVEAMLADGRLEIVAGKIVSAVEQDDGVVVTWRPRGADEPRELAAARIINCTGPQGNLLLTAEPLLRALATRGSIRPDAARLGIDVDAGTATIAADGRANPQLFALGPMTRGAFWEIVAVPDIRSQAWHLARRLSNAHWLEGEGL